MKYLCFALVILLLFSLVACTNAGDRGAGDVYPNDTSGTGSITGEDSYFFEERTATGINLDKIFSFEKNGDEVTLIGLSFDRTLDNISVKAFSMDLDGRIVDENTLNTGGRVPSTAGVAPTGMVWLLFVDWEHDDDDKISLEGVNLEAYDNSGNHVKSVVLDLPGISDDDLTPEVYLIIGEDGYFYVCFEGLIMQGFSGVFDENGTLLFDFTESDERKTRSIAKMPDGRVSALQMVMTMENAGASPVIKIIDADNKKYAAEVLYLSFGSSNWWEVFFANGYDGYDLLRCEKTVIYGVCHETGDLEVLAKYDVNYTFQDIHKFAVISSGNILKLDHSTTLGITVMKYTKTDAPIHTDKTKLVLGVFFSNDMISRTVSDFNKLSPKYEIEIKEYMGQRGVDFIGALDAYNLDLITGNIPDITAIHIIASMPLRSYFDKGVFADLYEFFDADPDINREDYVDSVLKALETDGKLYTMAPSFEIETLIGKKSVVGADMGWTWDEFFALLDKNPEAMPISLSRQSFSSESFVSAIIGNTSDTFINTSAGTCDFQSDIFTKLLEYGKRYPREAGDYGSVTANDFLSRDRLLLLESFGRLDYFHTTKLQAYFGEEITYKGYPTLDGSNGSSFYLYYRFGISSNSEHRGGAWEYIKFLLTEYQYMEPRNPNDGAIRDFPVHKDVLNRLIERDLAFEVNDDDKFPIHIDGAGMMDIITPSETDGEKLYALISSIDKISRTDHLAVLQIISEELPSYFDGQKTAEQVAAIIQSRAGIYMAEIS